MRLLAVDPGLLSGYAHFDYTDDVLELVETAELNWHELGEKLEAELSVDPANTAVAIERFIISGRTVKNTQSPWSLECIGMTQWLCYRHGAADFVLQNVNEAKNTFPNERLRHLGYWHRGGKGHALDAIRHSLLYLLHHGWRDPRLLT